MRDDTTSPDAKRILLVSSSGGVLLDVLALRPWWSRHQVVWVSVTAADTESVLAGFPVHWVQELSAHRPLAVLGGMSRARKIIRQERPDLIVSAGTGVAVPFFLVAAALRIPTFWVATLNVLSSPGIAARACSRLATRVIVHRPSQRVGHRGGVVVGELY